MAAVPPPQVPVSPMTIRLARGRHVDPTDGACVIEVASMLAGEPFSDHPVTVCPVIGAFLRAYNDALDDQRRQDLLPYAALVVGTRGDRWLCEARAARCREFAARRVPSGPWWTRRRRPPALPVSSRPENAALHAARAVSPPTESSHARVLAFLDELIAPGSGEALVADVPGTGFGSAVDAGDAAAPAAVPSAVC